MTPSTFMALAAEWRKQAAALRVRAKQYQGDKELRDMWLNEATDLENCADNLERLCAAWLKELSEHEAQWGYISKRRAFSVDQIIGLPAGQPKEERK